MKRIFVYEKKNFKKGWISCLRKECDTNYMHTIFNILLDTQGISSPSDILNVNISLKGLKGHQLEKGKQKKSAFYLNKYKL